MIRDANVVFILIDALRARNLCCYGYPKPTSPNIDSLAKKGVLFENAFSCNNTTDPSITTILSGKYPINHGVIRHGPRLQPDELSNLGEITFIQEILRSHGYITLGVDWLKRWHKRGYEIYYDTFHGQRDPSMAKYTQKYRVLRSMARVLRFFKMNGIVRKGKRMLKYGCEAGAVTDIASRLVKAASNKFFIFIHYWDTHTFYDPPKSYFNRFYQNAEEQHSESVENIMAHIKNETKRAAFEKFLRARNIQNSNYIVAQYDGAIAYVDHEIGRLIEVLKQCNKMDDTYIIVTSDHGESLTEHNIFFDHHGLYDVSIHAPLIIKGPDLPQGKRIEGLVQHTDLAPTLLDLLEISAYPRKTFDGKTLIPLINDEEELHPAIFAEEAYYERKRAIRTKRYKYIYALSPEEAMCKYCKDVHGGLEELYDLNKDPQEKQNIIQKNTGVAGQLSQRLHRWEKSFEKSMLKEGSYRLPPEEEREVAERLRKLGYF